MFNIRSPSFKLSLKFPVISFDFSRLIIVYCSLMIGGDLSEESSNKLEGG